MQKNIKKVSIIGTGKAIPTKKITSEMLDQQLNKKRGYTKKATGISERYICIDESASDLAVNAINMALTNATRNIEDIDCLISASGTMEQAIPCNAAKVHSRLKPQKPIPAFDINMTCLSSVMAIDIATNFLLSGQYKTIALFSSDIASVGVDLNELEPGGIFGDGAAAIILTSSESDNSSQIICSHFETFSQGLELCQIKGGGSLNHPSKVSGDYKPYGMFEMNGFSLYRLTAKELPGFIDRLFQKTDYTIKDIDWIVPHQASRMGLKILEKFTKVKTEKIVNIFETHGNQIAASIPTALHELVISGKLKKGDKILLIGSSAGISLGGLLLQW